MAVKPCSKAMLEEGAMDGEIMVAAMSAHADQMLGLAGEKRGSVRNSLLLIFQRTLTEAHTGATGDPQQGPRSK